MGCSPRALEQHTILGEDWQSKWLYSSAYGSAPTSTSTTHVEHFPVSAAWTLVSFTIVINKANEGLLLRQRRILPANFKRYLLEDLLRNRGLIARSFL
jgi:hypothetical protein